MSLKVFGPKTGLPFVTSDSIVYEVIIPKIALSKHDSQISQQIHVKRPTKIIGPILPAVSPDGYIALIRAKQVKTLSMVTPAFPSKIRNVAKYLAKANAEACFKLSKNPL